MCDTISWEYGRRSPLCGSIWTLQLSALPLSLSLSWIYIPTYHRLNRVKKKNLFLPSCMPLVQHFLNLARPVTAFHESSHHHHNDHHHRLAGPEDVCASFHLPCDEDSQGVVSSRPREPGTKGLVDWWCNGRSTEESGFRRYYGLRVEVVENHATTLCRHRPFHSTKYLLGNFQFVSFDLKPS